MNIKLIVIRRSDDFSGDISDLFGNAWQFKRKLVREIQKGNIIKSKNPKQ